MLELPKLDRTAFVVAFENRAEARESGHSSIIRGTC